MFLAETVALIITPSVKKYGACLSSAIEIRQLGVALDTMFESEALQVALSVKVTPSIPCTVTRYARTSDP